jgi:hypothetical protein
MEKEFALQFAEEWVKSWNSHDLNRILSHYTDDFEIESPLALKRLPASNGIVRGKDAVETYWRLGLDANPNLEFEIIDVLCGVTSISIYYLSKSMNRKVIEMMCFNNEMKVFKAIVNYA